MRMVVGRFVVVKVHCVVKVDRSCHYPERSFGVRRIPASVSRLVLQYESVPECLPGTLQYRTVVDLGYCIFCWLCLVSRSTTYTIRPAPYGCMVPVVRRIHSLYVRVIVEPGCEPQSYIISYVMSFFMRVVCHGYRTTTIVASWATGSRE